MAGARERWNEGSSAHDGQVTILTAFDKGRLRTRPPVSAGMPLLPPIKLSKTPMTSAERVKKSYHKRKTEFLDEHKVYLESKRIQSKERRERLKANATEEEKALIRAKARERLAKHRLKKKEMGIVGNVSLKSKNASSKPLTRKDQEKIDERRKKDRERKRLQRQGWSRQKKKAESQKAVERKRMKKISQTAVESTCNRRHHVDGEGSARSECSRRKALSRVEKSLPKDPLARQETINDLIRIKNNGKLSFNTRVRDLIKKCDRRVKRSIGRHLHSLDKESRNAARKLLMLSRQHLFSIKNSRSFTTNALRKADSKNYALVNNFLAVNSVVSSEKKHATKLGARLVLKDQLNHLFDKFKEQHPDERISKSFFYACRSKNMKFAQSTKTNQCLCESCTNISLKVKALQPAFPRLPTQKSALIDAILCTKSEEFHKRECIHMQCSSCGPHKLRDFTTGCTLLAEVQCKEWVNRQTEKGTKKVLENNVWKPQELLERLIKDLKEYPLHLFNARWQYNRFNFMKNNVQDEQVVMVYDFAENFRTMHQDEVQSAHWAYNQVTIHPVVCYYKCTCGEITTHSIVALSDDTQHDCFAVDTILRKVTSFLKDDRGLEFKLFTEWSDGCSAQYKSKGPFFLLHKRSRDGRIEKHFFGSRHGKNPSDGESAVVKSAVTRAIKCRRTTVQSAEDLFRFASVNLSIENENGTCRHFKRSFLLIKDIVRRKLPQMKPLKGTRQIHSIVSVGGNDFWHRDLSCTCQGCIKKTGCCEQDYMEEWKTHRFPSTNNKTTASENSAEALAVLSTSTMEYLESLTHPEMQEQEPCDSGTSLHQAVYNPQLSDPATNTTPNLQMQEPEPSGAIQDQAVCNPQPSQPSTDTSPENATEAAISKIREGRYVEALVYDIHGAQHTFKGIVEQMLNGEVSIRFMKRLEGAMYVWPDKDDIALVPVYDVCRVLAPPSLVARGRYKFQ